MFKNSPAEIYASANQAANNQGCDLIAFQAVPAMWGKREGAWCLTGERNYNGELSYRVAYHCTGDDEFCSAIRRTESYGAAMQAYIERISRSTTDIGIAATTP